MDVLKSHFVWRSIVLGIALVAFHPAARVQSQDEVGATVTAHGVTVSLFVPGTTYPRNALIQVTVQVRNVSNAAIPWQSTCDNDNPGLEVVRHDVTTGRFDIPTYPPALPEEQTMPCLPVPQSFQPGAVIQNQGFVVLRNAYLEAFVQLQTGPRVVQVTTPQLHFHLTPPRPPRVRLQTKPAFVATLRPPPGATGPLHYLELRPMPAPRRR